MIYLFFFLNWLLAVTLHNPQTIFSFNEIIYTDSDFYEEVFKDDWDNYDLNKKQSLLTDVLKKELSFIAAQELGINLHPSVSAQLKNRYNGLLVNNAYEHLIARTLTDIGVVQKNINNLLNKVEAHHILIGFSGSVQNTDAVLSQDGAKALADSVYILLQNEPSKNFIDIFGDYAQNYSIDPSVEKNKGFLGWVPWGRTVMSFQEPLFNLKLNMVSQPTLTEYGYHLILKTNEARSSYFYYNQSHYNDLAYKVAQNTLSFDILKASAANHDSLLLKNSGLLFYNQNIDSLFAFIQAKKRGPISGNKNILLGWLGELENFGVLFVAQNKGFGLKWFIEKLEKTSASRIPPLNDVDNLKLSIQSLLLQDLVLREAFLNKIDTTVSFKRDLLKNYKNILYSEYVSFLLNNIEKPDSSRVSGLYKAGVFNKEYVKPLRVVFSEMRVFSEVVAKEIINKLDFGFEFDSLLVQYGGSIKEPVSRGSATPLNIVAFNLKVGETSSVVNNKNGSFSIIRIERVLKEKPFDLNLVYAQIERKIISEEQELIKKNLLNYLIGFLNIKVNYKVLGL